MSCRHFCMSAVRGPVVRFRFRGLSGRFDRGPSARFVSLNVRVSRGRSGGAQLACTIATNPEPDTTHQTSKYRNLSLTVVATSSLLRSLVLYHRGQHGRLCWHRLSASSRQRHSRSVPAGSMEQLVAATLQLGAATASVSVSLSAVRRDQAVNVAGSVFVVATYHGDERVYRAQRNRFPSRRAVMV